MANTQKNKKTFGVSDIERYYNGKMPPPEMHELEKAALEDPFLADAMEGYTYSQSPSEEVIELKTRLNKRKQQGKSYHMLFRVAAMFVLIAGAGWLLYQLTFKDQDQRISYRNQLENNTSQPAPDTLENVTILPGTKVAVEEKDIMEEKNITEDHSGTASTIKIRRQEHINRDQKSFKMNEPETTNMENDSLEAADEKGHVAMAAPRFFKSTIEKKVQSDSNLLRNSLPVQNHIEPNEKVQIISKGNQVIITIKETPDGIDEMVLSKKKKNKMVKKSPSIIIEEAEPEESWNEFGQYLSDNINTLKDMRLESQTGTVKLSFDVNPSGEPVNINIEESLCKKCETEALRLLQEGPKWKKKSKRGKVIIRF